MTRQHHAGIAVAGAALLLAACGSSSTSSSGGGGAAAVQAAFGNYGNQSSAHIKIVATGGSNPGTFDLDVTKDALSGTGSFSGQTLTIIYAGGHAYAQTSAGGPYTQLPDDIAKPFKLFTISTFSSCFSSFLSKGGSSSKLDMLTSSSTTTLNGTAAVDYKASDGSGDVIISSGSSPLPLKLSTTDTGSSSSSSSSANPDCDSGTSSSSSSSSGGTTEIVWTYPGRQTTITPPPTAAA